MSAVADQVAIKCLGCGNEFYAPDRRWLYCSAECKAGKAPQSAGLRLVAPAGDAFTVEHFCDWAAELVLDSGDPWVVEPFQAEFADAVLSSTVSRRVERTGVKEAWLVVPEGNGKSTLLAGLALYHCEFTSDALVPVAASSRDQAKIIYRQAKGFVRRTDRLNAAFRCFDGYRRITHLRNDSQVEVFAADDRTGDGVIPTLALVDELHRHRSMDLYETWTGKLDKRGAQILVISTAGEPASEFELTRERLRQTADRVERRPGVTIAVADEFVLHDWALSEDGDPEDCGLVKEANPFSGITVDSLDRKRKSPTMSLPHWRRFVCNLPTRGGLAAITEAEWHAAAVDRVIPEGERIWVGLDVAWKWDTTAIVPLYWESSDVRLLGPATILEPPRDGTAMKPYVVHEALREIHARNPVHTVVMDPSNATELAEWISENLGARVIERAQTNQFAVADYEFFMEGLALEKLHHTGDPGLTRHVLNAVAKLLPGGDTKFDRPKETRRSGEQPRLVVDGLTAASMVHSEAVLSAMNPGVWAEGW